MTGVLVGKKAPDFVAKAVIGDKVKEVTLSSFKDSYIILFFYPLDFTFVCPTELHSFEDHKKEFLDRDTVVLGCSIDSIYSHLAWLNIAKEEGGIKGISYPIISDINKLIIRAYDVLNEDEGIAYRGLFLIDKERIVRHQVVNDLPLGRSIKETLRVLDSLLFFEKNGEVCPADWEKGCKGMEPTKEGLKRFLCN